MTRSPKSRTTRWAAIFATGALVATGLTLVPGTASANGDCPSYWAADTGNWSGSPAAGGDGSEGNPYKVGSELDLNEVRWCPSAHFVQIADVTLANPWQPILGEGVADGEPFTGLYNGAGYEISGLSADLPGEDFVGLFRRIGGSGLVKDLSFAGVNLVGRTYVGAVSGALQESGQVSKISVSGTVTGEDVVGGLVGYVSSAPAPTQASIQVAGPTITDVASAAAVTATTGRAGGIAGDTIDATISKAATSGTISGRSYVGGIVGQAMSTTLSDLATDVTVTAEINGAGGIAGLLGEASSLSDSAGAGSARAAYAAGGLVGSLQGNSTITDTAADVTVTTDLGGGGLVGQSTDYPTITRSVAAGAVNAATMGGGLIGTHMFGAITVTDSAASGAVTGERQLGGLAGFVGGKIHRSSASGAVTASADEAGGLVGVLATGYGVCGGAVCAATPPPDVPTEIRASYSTGNVQARSRAGGLVGLLADNTICGGASQPAEDVQLCAAISAEPTSTVIDSYSKGSVTATNVAGGLIGSTGDLSVEAVSDAEVQVTPVALFVTTSYSSGAIAGGTRGGVLGEDPGDALVTESFWDATANPGVTGAKGVGKTQSQLRDITTFTNAQWLIQAGAPATGSNVWGICVPPDSAVNSGYPFLLWQHDSDPCDTVPEAPVLNRVSQSKYGVEVQATLGSDGGSPLTQVQYQLNDEPGWIDSGGTSGTFTINGLRNYKRQAVRVRAVNRIGPSTASNRLVTGGTFLKVNAETRSEQLPVNKTSVLVRSVRTNGRIVVAKVFCTLRGNRLPKRLQERLCDPTVIGASATSAAAADQVQAAKIRKKKLRITARPACSAGLKVTVKIVAKASNAQRKAFTRTYKVDNKPRVKCSIKGTG